jgi:hypothetical protein
MKTQFKVFILFAIVILASFIPELFPTFFGDWYCTDIVNFHRGERWIISHWHWGFRHWTWFVMGFTLFIINVVSISKSNKNE